MRKTEFANGAFYHIYNRGVDKRDVFLNNKDYERFLVCLREFNRKDAIGSLYEKYLREKRGLSPHCGDLVPTVPESEPLVEIIAYCLNPNHYHLILRQLSEKGISSFMLKVSTGYTTYFNKKYKRSGSLFQGPFKAIHIDSNAYLLYLSAYVNQNHYIHGMGDEDWKYSSLKEYKFSDDQNINICNPSPVLEQFRNKADYIEFLEKNALHLKEKKEIQKYLLEE